MVALPFLVYLQLKKIVPILNNTYHFFVSFLLLFFIVNVNSQTNSPPTILATGDQFYCPLTTIPIAESFSITDIDDSSIDGLNIQISTGYVEGEDLLTLTGLHPNIISTWITSEGKLELTGIGGTPILFLDIISAVNDVVYSSSNPNPQGERFFSFTIGDANYLPLTDHFYQYVSSPGITWTDARVLAETYTYYGLQGYLATITYPEEAQLSGEQAQGTGWIGASDEETEGTWKWMTGPEAGSTFWFGNGNGTSAGSDLPYANWNNIVGSEPNQAGNEDYAHIVSPSLVPNNATLGSWNDLANTGDPSPSSPYHPQGFIVEYGGTLGDPELNLSASTKITNPEIVSSLNAERCGSGSVSLEATPSHGTILWFDTQTGGTPIATGQVFDTPILSNTTTYYALVSVNGCLQGARVPVTATIKTIPNISDITEQTICPNTSATLTATSSQGSVTWFDAPTGGNIVASGNLLLTPVLNISTTYYAEPELDGCIGSRVPATVSIQDVATPTANSPQFFCDIDNATVSDLIANGSSIKWYTEATGGSALDGSVSLTSQFYFATQTISGCESPIRLPVEIIVSETVNIPEMSSIPIITECDDDFDGITNFDLTVNESIILNGASASDFIISYYTDNTFTNQILNPSSYNNLIQGGETIYIKAENLTNTSCVSEGAFEIQVFSKPSVNTLVTFKNCDEDGVPDGFTDYNLSEINDLIVIGNTNDFDITYHLTLAEAQSNSNPVIELQFNTNISDTLFARVENSNGCFSISQVNLQVSTTSFPAGYVQELISCDNDDIPDGFNTFNLNQVSQDFLNVFPTGQNLSVHYYVSSIDAQLEQNEISNSTNYTNQTAFVQELYVRVESEDNGDCFGIGPHLRLIVNERPQFEIDQSDIFCLDEDPILLQVYNPGGNYNYSWTNQLGELISTGQTAQISEGGQYTVIATSTEGCQSFPYTYNVVESSIATITLDDITTTDFSSNNTITINPSNLGIGDYEFSLDNEFGSYQDTPFFDYVGAGDHLLFVRDKNGCGTAVLEVFILGFPKFFTPNGDNYNDYWNLKGWNSSYSSQSLVTVFDRYGKLIIQFSPAQQGWDGTFNGKPLIENDYWFVAQLVKNDGSVKQLNGHFSLVR